MASRAAVTGRPLPASPGRSLQARPAVHTLDVEPGRVLDEHPFGLLKENRALCLETANSLSRRAGPAPDSALRKAAQKIRNCSLLGAFRSLEKDVNYKVGQALCKSRLCPNCQRVLSVKRKASFLEWFDLNEEALGNYRFYHLVLTVPHSLARGVRTRVYTSQLVEYFAALRGMGKGAHRDKAAKEWWDKRVAGGFTSVELATGKRDKSAHIHLHILLIANYPLWRADRPSEFLKILRSRWKKITGDADPKKGVHLEPVYYLGPKAEKVYHKKGDSIDTIRKGVSECMKYTLKSDEANLDGFTDEFLQELLTLKNRYYGRFGCLTKKSPLSAQFKELDRLNQDFKDLEKIRQKELEQLYNPQSGLMHRPEDVVLAVTYFANTRPRVAPPHSVLNSVRGEKPRGGEKYFAFVDAERVSYFETHEKQEVARSLGSSLRNKYSAKHDLAVARCARCRWFVAAPAEAGPPGGKPVLRPKPTMVRLCPRSPDRLQLHLPGLVPPGHDAAPPRCLPVAVLAVPQLVPKVRAVAAEPLG